MPAQILICVDEHLQIGDCTYECTGAWPTSSSCLKRTVTCQYVRAGFHMVVPV